MKWFITIVLVLVMLPVVSALNVCEEYPQPNITCSLITPSISCSIYDYQILDENGTQLVNSSLTVFQDSIYYLNFTQERGDYIVRLCDDTTREIKVKEDDNMLLGVIFLVVCVSFLFAYISFNIADDKQVKGEAFRFPYLKIFFLGVSVLNTVLGVLVAINIYNSGNANSSLEAYLWFVGFVFLVLLAGLFERMFFAKKRWSDLDND